MKKLIIMILLFAGISFAQSAITKIDKAIPMDPNSQRGAVLLIYNADDDTFVPLLADSTGALVIGNPGAAGNATAGNQTTQIGIMLPTTFGHGTKTVSSTAGTMGSQSIKWVLISNNTSGTAYLGGSTVTTSAYGYKLNPNTAIKIVVDNLSDIYVIGDAVTLNYVYGN